MKLAALLTAGLLCACASTGKSDVPAWQPLLQGDTLEGWRGYQKERAPEAWRVEDGVLTLDGSGGDLITVRQYENFDLELEWKISPGGNSGIFYGVVEEAAAVWQSGAEMQVLDNAGYPGLDVRNHAGANYALHACRIDATRPVGEWNQVRIEVHGPSVRHYLNGELVVEFERWTDEWKALVAASKFDEFPGYGLAARGHLALQDHGNRVWYRNLRIREY